MDDDRPLTAAQRHFLAAFLGALPAIWLGMLAGTTASGVGAHGDLNAIFIRAFICAVPVAICALLAPRIWLFPTLAYGFGFYGGYTFVSWHLAQAFRFFFIIPALLTGEPLGRRAEPSYPELIWLLIFALWSGAFLSFLRRRSEAAAA